MRQRALPQSFWQQPNVANPQPPGIINYALPPLPLGGEESGDMTPVEEVNANPMLFTPSAAATAQSASSSSNHLNVIRIILPQNNSINLAVT